MRLHDRRRGWLFVTLAILASSVPVMAQGVPDCDPLPAGLVVGPGWPLEPTDADHHVAAGLEYMEKETKGIIHAGLDILATPCASEGTLCDSAPFVVSTVGGKCEIWGSDIEIVSGTRRYTYAHLREDTIPADVVSACNEGCPLEAGTKLGQVYSWSDRSDYSHLHYSIANDESDQFENPVLQIEGFESSVTPSIWPPEFFENDSGACEATVDLRKLSSFVSGCETVKGDVDIVVRVADHHRGDNEPQIADDLAPRSVRYRVCSEGEPGCDRWVAGHDFSSMPRVWRKADDDVSCIYHSIRHPARSRSTTAVANEFYVVPTNFGDRGEPDATGAWTPDTDGFYSVTIEAVGVSGKASYRTVPVCVDNNGQCGGKLVLRDCDAVPGSSPESDSGGDRGGEPSPCGLVDSPDISRIDSTDGGIAIRVCAWNLGCTSIPADTPVTASFSVSSPLYFLNIGRAQLLELESTLQVGELTTEEGAATGQDWSVGDPRCFALPVDESALGGAPEIVVTGSVFMDGDKPNDEIDTSLDNNKSTALLSLR